MSVSLTATASEAIASPSSSRHHASATCVAWPSRSAMVPASRSGSSADSTPYWCCSAVDQLVDQHAPQDRSRDRLVEREVGDHLPEGLRHDEHAVQRGAYSASAPSIAAGSIGGGGSGGGSGGTMAGGGAESAAISCDRLAIPPLGRTTKGRPARASTAAAARRSSRRHPRSRGGQRPRRPRKTGCRTDKPWPMLPEPRGGDQATDCTRGDRMARTARWTRSGATR